MRSILVFIAVSSMAAFASASPVNGRWDISVLYVGAHPDRVELELAEDLESLEVQERILQLKAARTESFRRFLADHFITVDVIYSHDYDEGDSDRYDVTVFGDLPQPFAPETREYSDDGSLLERKKAVYLSDEFDNAAILINVVSPRVGEPLQYKMDWMCLCLDAHAHDVNTEHAIFRSPFKVTPTFTNVATPENYRKYYNGKDLPEALPMWRVQSEGYTEEKGFPPGMLSTAAGFDDAPDGEVISSGVGTKSVDSVALGRHGNFFHWGFSASPDAMTDEARQVFINAVHYIRQFDGQRPYSRRQFRSSTRETALDAAYRVKTADYVEYVSFRQQAFERQKAHLASLQAAGENLSFANRRKLAQSSPDIEPEETWLRTRVLGLIPDELVARYGTDLDAYLDFYEENLEHLVPGEKRHQYVVDPVSPQFAESNRHSSILHAAISAVEANPDDVEAWSILERYTNESFESGAEWRKWYEGARRRLYFSEVNGYRFEAAPAVE